MDVRLPDGSGIEACREIRATRPETRVVMLTSYPDEEAVLSAIIAGASGYLLKQVRGRDLVSALEAVGRGESLLDPAVTEKVLERVRRMASGSATDELAELTAQERKILLLVAEGKTNKEIAAEVFLSDKTVKNYVSSILSKLNLQRRAQAAAFVAKHHLAATGRATSLPAAAAIQLAQQPASRSLGGDVEQRAVRDPPDDPAGRRVPARRCSARRPGPRASRRRPERGERAVAARQLTSTCQPSPRRLTGPRSTYAALPKVTSDGSLADPQPQVGLVAMHARRAHRPTSGPSQARAARIAHARARPGRRVADRRDHQVAQLFLGGRRLRPSAIAPRRSAR